MFGRYLSDSTAVFKKEQGPYIQGIRVDSLGDQYCVLVRGLLFGGIHHRVGFKRIVR